jgi:molecular chaperone DnaJ
MAKDYYDLLGVAKTASQDEIKKAYRKLAHTHHPDKQGGDEARFKEINEAYGVLGDAEKRRQYDQFGQAFNGGGFGGGGQQGFGGFDFSQFGGQGFDFGGTNFEDLFTDIFTGGRGGARREARGSDVQVDIEITFEEMVRGAKKTVQLRTFVNCSTCHGTGGKPGSEEKNCATCQGQGQIRKQVRTMLGVFTQMSRCDTCHGRGKTFSQACTACTGSGRVHEERKLEIAIPAGIEDGQALSLTGEGEAGERGVKAGDLFVVVHVKPHAQFKRQGDNILSTLSLSYSQLVLGDKVDVPTLEGTVAMKIPAGTEPGEVFRIRGGGIPRLGRFGTGDHLVTVAITIPKRPSGELKKAIEALDRLT